MPFLVRSLVGWARKAVEKIRTRESLRAAEIAMRTSRTGSWTVRLLGWIIFIYGAFSTIRYVVLQILHSVVPDMVILLADSTLWITGVVTLVVGSNLKKLEQRLERLENPHR